MKPMASGVDEVETTMHTIINNIPPIKTILIREILFKLVVDVLDDLVEAKNRKGSS